MDCLCLICESSVEAFLSFGEMPLANGFLSPEEFNDETATNWVWDCAASVGWFSW